MDELIYSDDSFRHKQLTAFASFLKDNNGNDEDTFFLVSGDLSHFGEKFGDEEPASEHFIEADKNDQLFMQAAASGNPRHLIYAMKEKYDRYRICGFPPLLTFLQAFEGLEGTIHTYNLWDEKDRNSAVSYGSILYQ
jgi:AmmeMemoRadiSam system protein B